MAVSPIAYTSQTDTGQKAAETRGKGSNLDMSDFMNLLVAQMVNQDMMNPVSDTDFIAQMAQFSSLQGIQTLQEYVQSSYAVSYAGKYVMIYHQNERTGNMEEIRGQVEKISFYQGSPVVYVDGERYYLHEVMEISHEELKKPVEEPDETGGTDTGDTGDTGNTEG
jgi:flagellar basal-body rod modification protein FlgD